jgi:hypothetical protein
MALFVEPRGDVDTHIREARVRAQDSRRLQRVDDPERAIEPAGVVLAFEMRPGEHPCARRAAVADHVGDAVDPGVEPRRLEPRRKPVARLDVLRRQGGAVNAGLVGAESGEFAQVAEDAVGIDGRHGCLPNTSAASLSQERKISRSVWRTLRRRLIARRKEND